jgi:diaminopimelate decarboxylase
MVTRVLYVKQGPTKSFTIVDAGMNDLLRPTLYSAYHDIWPVAEARRSGPVAKTDVVGPVCETGDFIALERELPEMQPGDLLAVLTAGAYGAVLANTYNSRPLVPEVMVKGGNYAVIRPRPSPSDQFVAERLPAWLTKT